MTHALIQESIDKRQHVRGFSWRRHRRRLRRGARASEDRTPSPRMRGTSWGSWPPSPTTASTSWCRPGIVGRGRRGDPFLHRTALGFPRYRLRPDQHRGGAAGRLRGSGGERHLLHTMARHGAQRREDGVAKRDLLPLGPGLRSSSPGSGSTPSSPISPRATSRPGCRRARVPTNLSFYGSYAGQLVSGSARSMTPDSRPELF